MKEELKIKALKALEIIDWRGFNRVESLECIVGNRYVKFVRYGEYTGEDGTILERLLKLEKEVYKKSLSNK